MLENSITNLGSSVPDRLAANSDGCQERGSGGTDRLYRGRSSRSIKVVWLCANFDGAAGGTGTHLMKWVKHLEQSEFEVIFVHGTEDEEDRIASLLGCNGHVRVVPIPELRKPDQLFLPGLLKLYQLFRRERPDIVHTILIQSDILGTLAAKLAGVPVVISSAEGELFSTLTTTRAKMLFYRLGYGLIQSRIDRVIAISHSVGRNLVEDFGVDPEKIHVIHPGVSDCDFSVNSNGQHGLEYASPSIGVVSRLVEGKGVEHFLMAVPEILAARPETRFFIVGDGPLKTSLVKLAMELGVVSTVQFCGRISPAAEVMCGLDVVVMPSLEEGLPWVVLEALALGKPVVATNVGGIPEVITHGLHGLLVEPGDSVALARAVIHLLEDPQRASALAQAGQARVAQKFRASREAAEIHELYRSLLVSRNCIP